MSVVICNSPLSDVTVPVTSPDNATVVSVAMWKTVPSPVSNVIVLFALEYEKSSTPATAVVFAVVKRPSSSTVKIGISVEEPYTPGVTPVFANSVARVITPVFEVAVPVTLPVSVRSNPSSRVSSFKPSAAISRPSTSPVTVISPVTSIPAPKSTFSSN